MELSEVNIFIKKFLHQIYKYDGLIWKLTAYDEGILTFTQLTPSPLNSMIMEVAIWHPLLEDFIWLVPYEKPLVDADLGTGL